MVPHWDGVLGGISDPNKGAFDFRLFVVSIIWTGRYAQALNTPAPVFFCTDVDVVKWYILLY